MTGQPRLILHVGGPKCGSSALQAALSQSPVLRSETGSVLAYTAAYPGGAGWKPLRGAALGVASRRSVHGYASWPNLARSEDPEQVFAALDRVWRGAGRGGTVPVLSNEGWLGQAGAFADRLPHWFDAGQGGAVEVLGFARPPLDWLNSAYWQWGVWTGLGFQAWLERGFLPYRLGSNLAAWAALPGTRLSLHLSGDVIEAFARRYDVPLVPAPVRNAAVPPALVGFMMRNRRFRPTPHDSATEFIFSRWCRVEGAPRLWALMPRHVQMVWQAVRAETETLFSLVSEDAARAARKADPRWISSEPYHDLVRGGCSRLDDPEELAQLYRAVCRGVRAAAEAARESPPQLQPVLGTAAPIHAWDVALAQALGHLVRLDTGLRRGRLMRLSALIAAARG